MSRNIKLVVFSFLAIVMANCKPAPTTLQCEDVKNGTFSRDLSDGTLVIFTRKDNRLAEVYQGETDTLYLEVKWLNDCEYEMHAIPGAASQNYPAPAPVNIKILKVEKDYYTYKAQSGEMIKYDTAFIIK
jgi:hypothetical protein